jgi:anti-sigma factor RsiW
VSCDPQRVTALVDDVLEGEERATLEAHVAGCEACRSQAADEKRLRASLRELPAPEPPFGLEQRVRRRLRGRGRLARSARLVLPLAAVLVLALWARGYAPLLAWELSRDHDHCFEMKELPVQVPASQPTVVTGWFDERGTHLPVLPETVGSLALVGGRYCRLVPDLSRVAHVYYTSDGQQISVFAVPHAVRIEDDFTTRTRDNAVVLVNLGRSVVGVVGEDADEVEAFASRLRTSVAVVEGPASLSPRAVPPTS